MSMPENNSAQNALAIIGDEDIVLGFQALGFKVFAVKEPGDYNVALQEAVQQRAAVCLVQDNIYNAAEELIKNYQSLPLPVFIPFSKSEKTDLLDAMVKDIRLKATGAF